MPSLSPGHPSQTIKAARVRLKFSGSGAASAAFSLEGDDVLSLTNPRPGFWAIEAQGPGEANLLLSAKAGRGGPMTQSAALSLVTVPVSSQGTPAILGTTLDVMGLVIEGRTRLEVLRVEVDADQFWSFTNLLPPGPVPSAPLRRTASGRPESPRNPTPTRDADGIAHSDHGPLISEARRIWGDLPRLEHRLLFAVDRSSSMTWAFATNGLLTQVAAGAMVVAEVALATDSRADWATYGSGADHLDRLHVAIPTTDPGVRVETLTPELFASGADAQVAVSEAGQRGYAEVILITDTLPEYLTSEPLPDGVAVTVLWVGCPLLEEDWPRQDLDSRAALNADGIDVLPVPESAEMDRVGITTAGLLAARLRVLSAVGDGI